MIFALLWVLAGVLAYGFAFACLQGIAPELAEKHRNFSIAASLVMGVCGPFGLITLLLCRDTKYGLKFK
jgi:hypothetical protein